MCVCLCVYENVYIASIQYNNVNTYLAPLTGANMHWKALGPV